MAARRRGSIRRRAMKSAHSFPRIAIPKGRATIVALPFGIAIRGNEWADFIARRRIDPRRRAAMIKARVRVDVCAERIVLEHASDVAPPKWLRVKTRGLGHRA